MSKDPQMELAAATARNGRIRAINPSGDLVDLPPGSVRLVASLERGTHLAGLKAGWRLATDEDVNTKRDEETARAAAEGSPAAPVDLTGPIAAAVATAVTDALTNGVADPITKSEEV